VGLLFDCWVVINPTDWINLSSTAAVVLGVFFRALRRPCSACPLTTPIHAWPLCCPAAHFSRVREPKVLITTCYKPSKGMYAFLAEMLVSHLSLVPL